MRIAKEQERDERKRAAAERKRKEEERRILDLIRSRGIKVERQKGVVALYSKKILCIA